MIIKVFYRGRIGCCGGILNLEFESGSRSLKRFVLIVIFKLIYSVKGKKEGVSVLDLGNSKCLEINKCDIFWE